MSTRLQTNARLRKALRKVQKPQSGWLDIFPAVIGKADGTVLTGTAGEIWVHNILNGQDVRVHNSVVPIGAPLHVEVGRKVEQPNLWQVKGVRETWNIPAGLGQVADHKDQHVFRQHDTVPVDRKQEMWWTVWVSDPSNFLVAVYGGTAPIKSGWMEGETDSGKTYKEMDLSSYVPATGAKFILIVVEEDGTFGVVEGTGFDAPALRTAADIPLPAYNQYPIAHVLLYESMDQLVDSDIRVIAPITANYLLNADAFVDLLAGIDDIQSAFEALDDHAHAEIIIHVHGLERWNGESGQTVFQLVDFVTDVEGLLLNGIEEDPLGYSLSADGTQITLDTALPEDMTVIAHTILEAS